jgi:quercetin dioxygenase-like cupin family protein
MKGTPMSDTLKLTPHESVTIRSSTPDALEVEVRYGSGGSHPPKHFHPEQDEHFEVLAGSLRVRIDGEERTLEAGDTIDIPRGAVHQMWNPGDEPVYAVWQTRPAGRTEEWFRALDSLQRQGRLGSDGMPSLLAFGAYLTEYGDVMRLAGAPQPLLRAALGLLGVVGRLRGYRPNRPAAAS